MPCCDDPECECNNPVCAVCGEPLFGFEMGPECELCLEAECDGDAEDDDLQTPHQPG